MPSQHHHSICSKRNYCYFPKFCSTGQKNNFYFSFLASVNFPISVHSTVIYLVLQDKNLEIILDTSLFSISHTKSDSKSYWHLPTTCIQNLTTLPYIHNWFSSPSHHRLWHGLLQWPPPGWTVPSTIVKYSSYC